MHFETAVTVSNGIKSQNMDNYTIDILILRQGSDNKAIKHLCLALI